MKIVEAKSPTSKTYLMKCIAGAQVEEQTNWANIGMFQRALTAKRYQQ